MIRWDEVQLWPMIAFSLVFAQNCGADKVIEQSVLAEQYAHCAAYYLMISKADPKLRKLARVGEVAADNARLLGNSRETLNMMALETRRMLAQIDNDWGNMGIVIAEKADACKAMMVAE